MAESKSIQSTGKTGERTNRTPPARFDHLADDVREIVGLAYPIEAMLRGAYALLEDPEHGDSNGNIWSAQEIIGVVLKKVRKQYALANDRGVCEACECVAGIDLSNVRGAA